MVQLSVSSGTKVDGITVGASHARTSPLPGCPASPGEQEWRPLPLLLIIRIAAGPGVPRSVGPKGAMLRCADGTVGSQRQGAIQSVRSHANTTRPHPTVILKTTSNAGATSISRERWWLSHLNAMPELPSVPPHAAPLLLRATGR
jgi:hypothetical protein